MGTLLVIVSLVLLVASIMVLAVALRRPVRPDPHGRPLDPLSFKALSPGAIVGYRGVDYIVRGSITYGHGPLVRCKHFLVGNDQAFWLSVEEDCGHLELAMWVKRTDLVALWPSGQHVVDGVRLHEQRRDHAPYTTESETGLPAQGELDFVDYANADKSLLLSFERWAPGMDWIISTGRSISPDELTVYRAPSA